MARATVLKCDACGTWDSEDTIVRNVSIAGPRFDLCTKDRMLLLIHCGVDPELAGRYQAMVDERVSQRGNMPALSAAKGWTPGAEPGSPVDLDNGQRGLTVAEADALEAAHQAERNQPADPEPVDEPGPEAQTEPVAVPAKKGSSRK